MYVQAIDRDARMWGMICHLSSLIGYFAIPVLGNLAGPAIVWLLKREEHPFIDDQGKESLNFQLALTVYSLVAGAVLAVLFISIIGIPFALLFLLFGAIAWLAAIALIIYAAIQANQGVPFRYPLTIRFLR